MIGKSLQVQLLVAVLVLLLPQAWASKSEEIFIRVEVKSGGPTPADESIRIQCSQSKGPCDLWLSVRSGVTSTLAIGEFKSEVPLEVALKLKKDLLTLSSLKSDSNFVMYDQTKYTAFVEVNSGLKEATWNKTEIYRGPNNRTRLIESLHKIIEPLREKGLGHPTQALAMTCALRSKANFICQIKNVGTEAAVVTGLTDSNLKIVYVDGKLQFDPSSIRLSQIKEEVELAPGLSRAINIELPGLSGRGTLVLGLDMKPAQGKKGIRGLLESNNLEVNQ